MTPRVVIPVWTRLTSLGVHGALIGGLGWIALRSLQHSPAVLPPAGSIDQTFTLELPAYAGVELGATQTKDPIGELEPRVGGVAVPRVDTGGTGRGGDETVDKPAIHLSDVDERMRLSPDLRSRLERDQAARLRSSADRASREDRRSTTHPMELTFLATGPGEREERRAVSPRDPSRGARLAAIAMARGGGLGATHRVDDEDGTGLSAGVGRVGATTASPGVGVHDGRIGADHRTSAAVATGRPDVTHGPVAVLALKRARPNDNVDSEQEVATTVEKLVHASTFGGAIGDGAGGSGGGGAPGAGGAQHAGAHPLPLGLGEGDWLDIDTNDPRLVPYFRRIHAKVEPLWADAFPQSAMALLKQGTVILEFTIARDGSVAVSWPPARPSGIDEFDRNCARAIRLAGPFDPIPKELGVTSLRVRAPFVAANPVR